MHVRMHTHTHTHIHTHTHAHTHTHHTRHTHNHTHTHTHTRHTHKHTYSHTHTQPYAIKGWVSRQSQSKFSHQLLTSHSELVAHTVCSLWTLLVPLQWEEFLKLGDEVETSVVEEKIKSQRPEHCALLIYTVSYGNLLVIRLL